MILYEILNQVWTHDVTDARPLIRMVNDAFDREEITDVWRMRLILYVNEEIALLRMHKHGDDTRPELQRIAEDRQNVHTKHVNEQTAKNESVLLGVRVPKKPKTLIEIADKITNAAVVKDMATWYRKSTCRNAGDYLYRRLLDGLWVYIHKSEHKDELLKRLKEEITESVGVCCEGHISRLCNVLVGFDKVVEPVVSTGQLLQERIASIAAKELTVEQKVCEAWTVFEELQIPVEERTSWIAAF